MLDNNKPNKINNIILTSISYATEELDRVKMAMVNCLPPDLRESSIDLRHLQSQFKDKMKFLTITLDKIDDVEATIKYFNENIDEKGKTHLKN